MFKSSYIPKYFKAQELVSPEYYEIWGEDAFNLFDPHILRCLDNFRDKFGQPIIINNYSKGYLYSGLRPPQCEIGAKRSYHKKAVAFDLKTDNMNSLRAFINEESEKFFISRVENFDKTPNWCHVEFTTELVMKTYYFDP